MENLNFIYNRKSIRKFKDEKVKHDDLIEIIKAGMQAPSAHNVQNWHYVVVESEKIIEEIAKIITEKHSKIIQAINDEERTKRFNKMIKYYTFFKDAPALILVFGSSYEPTGIDLLNEIDNNESQNFIDVHPGIQNIGATVENILLAISALGYGGCWMTGPLFAKKEIENFIKLKDNDFSLYALIPVGVPLKDRNRVPKREVIEDKITFM